MHFLKYIPAMSTFSSKNHHQSRHKASVAKSEIRKRRHSVQHNFNSDIHHKSITTECVSGRVQDVKTHGALEDRSCHCSSVVLHVIDWLEKRKKSVPPALKCVNFSLDVDQILKLLPSLRERERRALTRFISKKAQGNHDSDPKQVHELLGSDDEYDETQRDDSFHQIYSEPWPSHVKFSNNYRWDSTVPPEIKEKYSPSNKVRLRAPSFSRKVYFKRITDRNHPAFGEYGLYCALPTGAPPGTWLLDYVGHITLGEDQDKQSDYVSDFGEKSELACDANTYGNEARFLNDFRNTGRYSNVEFNFRRDENGEFRQGVYVKLKKNVKNEGFDGVKQHEELLVSYGKSYWRSRVGNLTDFVWRLPGQEILVGSKYLMEDSRPVSS